MTEISEQLLTILYDTLVDDDEDIRGLGAAVASLILCNNSSQPAEARATLSLSTYSAKRALLHYLSSKYQRSTTLVLGAIWRLTGLNESIDVAVRSKLMHPSQNMESNEMDVFFAQLTPVSTLLENATQQQNVVFEEEKQNLYLDPVVEAEAWAQVLIDVEEEAWSSGVAAALKLWTESGLSCLLNAIEDNVEGPLGLTSKADVHALFMRVLLMARVLVLSRLVGTAKWSKSKEGLSMSVVSADLQSLYERGRHQDLHQLILSRIERILKEIGISVG